MRAVVAVIVALVEVHIFFLSPIYAFHHTCNFSLSWFESCILVCYNMSFWFTHSHTACLQSWGEPAASDWSRSGWEESSADICRHANAAAGRWENRKQTVRVCLNSPLHALSTRVLVCVHRYRSRCGDPSANRRDVLRSRPFVHAHHSPAAGMWSPGPENSWQLHPAERIPHQGVCETPALRHMVAFTASLTRLWPWICSLVSGRPKQHDEECSRGEDRAKVRVFV